ncbi:hypothetical protein COCVIDRAFT_19320 [Bipolaris victoriae FI3]|uniref:Uncharacterized protein n=1 Tax=Bipolaris victoriae (strain FI3) TaxID=930091 RepID=W7E7P3_BIPV3|nr:hypothetical protein COCVIDRAFT_19320 [Bipolaris victoriae FI3]
MTALAAHRQTLLSQSSTASESASWVRRQQLSKSCHKLHAGPNPCTYSSAHPRIARRQQAIDDDKWVSEVAKGPVWQLARQLSFDTLFNGEEYSADHPDLVADGWTKMARGFLGFIAGPRHVTLKRCKRARAYSI